LKKVISIVLTITFIFMTMFMGVPVAKAITAGDLTLNVTANPTSLSGEGDVTFTFKVTNNTSSTVNNVSIIYDGGEIATIASISAGGTESTNKTLTIPESKLGTSLVFTAKCDSVNVDTDSVVISKKTLSAELTAKVSVSRTTAVKNSSIVFTITLENTGEATLSNIEVYLSPLNSSAKVGTVSSLAAGAKRTVTYTHKLTEDVTVTPTVKYTANGTTETKTLPNKTLSISDPDIEMTITPDKTSVEAGDEITFDVVVRNVGNISFTDVTIYDHQQSKVSAKYSAIEPNERIEATTSIPFDNDTTLNFTVTAKDSTGVVYTFESNTVSIEVSGEDKDAAVTMGVATDTTALEEAGTVTFEITVTNDSEDTFQNAVITEETIGDVHTFTTLPQGTKYTEIEYEVTETQTFNFVMTLTDASGKEYTVTADPLEVTVGATEENPFGDASDVNSAGTLGTLLVVIIILIVLIVGVGTTLFILMWKEKKAKAGKLGKAGNGPKAAKLSKGPKPPKFKGRNNF